MAGTTGGRKRKRSGSIAAAAAGYIPEHLVQRILLLLPSRSVLRFRAVCKAWRNFFSDPKFALEHHRLQPDLPLVSILRNDTKELRTVDYCVKALDLRTGDFRYVARFTGADTSCLTIHGSCDGLLLLSYESSLYVCNPATHQCTRIGTPSYSSYFVAFYRHDSTGEYRALLCRGYGSDRNFYILVAGSGGRTIGRLPIPSEEDGYNFRSAIPSGVVAVLLRGNLHWPPEPWYNHRILVLNTATEVFRWMDPPPVTREHMPVIEMEGKLAILSCGEDVTVVELWLLEDYEKQVWVCKYQVELSALDISTMPDLHSEYYYEGWLRFFMSEGRVAVVTPQQRLLVSDMNGNLQERFRCYGSLLRITQYTLKESLVRHAFFNNSEDESLPIFQGL
ncbi:unnamed protein product [Urochloa decumbens]|uniref:F-box domain-containing protein n=1 Tax=Urochloa decumbens TaxID=240449 RepID=A0ABC8XSV3_9POAL